MTIFSTLFVMIVFGQPDTTTIQQIDEQLISEHTTYFSIEDHFFQGADSLLALMGGAQFVALGEIHDSRQLSKFTSALLIYLHSSRFENLAVETGPWSVEKLQTMAKTGERTISNFYDSYSLKLFDIYPIPFYKGETDLEFLRSD